MTRVGAALIGGALTAGGNVRIAFGVEDKQQGNRSRV